MNILQEAKELLGKITPWPWGMKMSAPTRILKNDKVIFALLFDETENTANNASFIARSPELVEGLIKRVEKLEKSVIQRSAVIQRFITLHDAGALCCDCHDWSKAIKEDFSECAECEIYELAEESKKLGGNQP